MPTPRAPRRAPISWKAFGLALGVAISVLPVIAGAGTGLTPGGSAPGASADRDPVSILSTIRPDYRAYIAGVRPIESKTMGQPSRVIYMALVKRGADDPTLDENAPHAGPGAQNDIIYDRSALDAGRSGAWVRLLLDHEYFHARHLAGATSLPLPRSGHAGVQSHFYEAAAWGFNVAEARAGRYAGLREDEFREALNKYGDHYRALRRLLEESEPENWRSFDDLLDRPAALVTKNDSPPRAAP